MKTQVNTSPANSALDLIPNIVSRVTEKIKKDEAEILAEIKTAPRADLLGKYSRFQRFVTPSMTKLEESALREKMTVRAVAFYDKRIQAELYQLSQVMYSGEFKGLKISVEWAKSRTYGSSPSGEAFHPGYSPVSYGPVSGCGYDKLSTCVAGMVNQCLPFMRRLYLAWEANLSNTLTPVLGLRDFFGYGSGYGALPQFEGGVGVSCYDRICKAAGLTFETVAGGKSFDVFTISQIHPHHNA